MQNDCMDWKHFWIVFACVAAAFTLAMYHKDGAIAFLTLIGGSPVAKPPQQQNAGTTTNITEAKP